MTPPVRVGVSACLLGQSVRYDGGHKRDPFLCDVLGREVQLVPVCPEVEVGMGVPRDTLRLVGAGGSVRLIAPRTGRDFTDAMNGWAEGRARTLEGERLSGYVLKQSSPSCGLRGVKRHDSADAVEAAARDGVGLFAAALERRLPRLPIVEESSLVDPSARDGFIARVFVHHAAQLFFDGPWTLGGLVSLHAAHKLLLMAHDPDAYRALGRLVGGADRLPRAELRDAYFTGLMAAVSRPVTPGRHGYK